jgi:hypothetical protein
VIARASIELSCPRKCQLLVGRIAGLDRIARGPLEVTGALAVHGELLGIVVTVREQRLHQPCMHLAQRRRGQ